MNNKLEMLCRMSQKNLKKHVTNELKDKYQTVINRDGYVYAQGEVPILLVAHMDTVHKELPKAVIYDDGKMSSPQGIGGDDRCGIYMILEIIKKHNCSVLFCEDEEIGMIGASKFIKEDFAKELEFNYMIELDRRGSDDAVFYDCDNPEFEDFITDDGDWRTAWGSFSDISTLAPAIGCAAVNFSCGYYNAHTTNEYIVLEEMEENIKKVCNLIERTGEDDKFEYIEAKYSLTKYSGYGGYGSGSYSKYGYNDYSFLYDKYTSENNPYDCDDEEDFLWGMYGIRYVSNTGKDMWEDVYARSEWEAIGRFLESHPLLTYSDIEVNFYGYDDCYV